MTKLTNNTNNTIAGANNNTILSNKGENNMETIVRGTVRRNSKFGAAAKATMESRMMDAYNMFKGYKTETELMMPKKICFANIEDLVKFFSKNYAIAGATGIVTEGVYRVINATSVEEISKTVKGFGEVGTEAKSGQRYVEYGKLIQSVKVVPRLGGGAMTIKSCSKFEVKEFFTRLKNLDTNALTMEDVKAIQDDMQIIGRVMQEIAIDIAKDKSLDAGVDLMDVFAYIPALSRLIRKSDTGMVDNVKDITSMIEDAISKNPVINTGVEIDSIPNYAVTVEEFEAEHIKDWASRLQMKVAAATEDFFNTQVMPVVKMAGVTKEDLEIQQLIINHGTFVKEVVKIMDLYNAYIRSLESTTDHKNDDMNARVSAAKTSADKEVKAAFRDTLYAMGRTYGYDEAMVRKLVYGATMVKGVHKANMAKAMGVLGEEDMLLMWSNEEGIALEAVNVELVEVFEELFDAEEIDSMAVNFIDDIAYNEFGEEVAYGCGMKALNGEGTIVAEGNEFKFLPAKSTKVAPIGTKRVALMNRYNNNGLMSPFFEAGSKTISAQDEEDIEKIFFSSENAFFIPQTKTGEQCAIGVLVNKIDPLTKQVVLNPDGTPVKEPKLMGTAVQVGDGYVNDMFVDYKEVAGVKVQANNKKHTIEKAINTKYGILLVLSC